MPKGTPITYYEREKIEVWLRIKKRKVWIAKKLGRDYSVIKREIKRNSGLYTPYSAVNAEHYAKRRKKNTNKRKLDKWQNVKLKEWVETQLQEGWSPEEISGRLGQTPLPLGVSGCRDKVVSHESIYQWIYEGSGKYLGLYKSLRRKQRVRKNRFYRKKRAKILLLERVGISERPEIVAQRKRIGDWETDSVICSGKSILSVQQERTSKLCRLHKCENKSALASEQAVRDSIDSLPRDLWLTITRDNGTENALHHRTEVPSYFCDPYASWQKGGIENLNGLIREYFPKKINIDTLLEEEIYRVQEKLNNRPRKALHYLTPNEVITQELEKGL